MASEGPFEWLAGGLFFGKRGNESIDSTKDVLALLRGISENLQQILDENKEHNTPDEREQTSSSTTTPEKTPSSLLAARLARLRFLLYDERRIVQPRSGTPTVASNTVQALTGDELHDLISRLLQHLHVLPFESRKDVAAIFNYLLVSGLDGADASAYRPLMEVFRNHLETHFRAIMSIILAGHDATEYPADVCLHFGSMYRACLRHPSLYQQLTEASERFILPFLDTYVHLPNFDVASDSMETLRLVLTAGGDTVAYDETVQQEMALLAADFLTREYDAIWDVRFPLLLSETANYMTRRVALQILSTVLLTRTNYAIMIRYVASRKNLILIMKLLRDTSPHITLDAFHVFKVFVANPDKPPEVVQILKDNKVKLCAYLRTLHQEKESSDPQFRDEKALIVSTIEAL